MKALAVDVLMHEFLQYFSAAGLAMNPTKSELIVFRRKKQETVLTVSGQEEAQKIRLLGVNLDKNYKFESHATQVVATVKTKVSKLSEVVKILDYPRKKKVTESVVISTISYCLAIWGSRRKLRKKVQVAMNHAVRLVLGLDDRASISDGLQTLDWLNLDNLWRLEMVTALMRVRTSKVPAIITDILTKHTSNRYLIRADGLRSSWWPRNTYGELAFVHQAVDAYNQLRVGQRTWFHDRERRLMTKTEVRQELKKDLIRHYGNLNRH